MVPVIQTDAITLVAPLLILVIFSSYGSGAPHVQRFNSHVSFSTPASSFYHGVGDVQPIQPHHPQSLYGNMKQKYPKTRSNSYRSLHDFSNNMVFPWKNTQFEGYPREKPSIPFNYGFTQSNPYHTQVAFGDNSIGYLEPFTIPILPASPYKVDSPDPESLWPEGLFIPPTVPVKYGTHDKKQQHPNTLYGINNNLGNHFIDPYYLDGDNALRAFTRAKIHGELFYHEIPHTRALLANQELRISNGLRPHRLGSIRSSSPWYRT